MFEKFTFAHRGRLSSAFSDADKICLKEPDNPIHQILREDFYQDRVLNSDAGCFMPIPFPTGSGKTHNSISLIFDMLLDDAKAQLTQGNKYKPRYCFYITDSVDNVKETHQGLLKRIDDSDLLTPEQSKVLTERVMYAPANDASLSDFLSHENIKRLDGLFDFLKHPDLRKKLDAILNGKRSLGNSGLDIVTRKLLKDKNKDECRYAYTDLINFIQAESKSREFSEDDARFLAGLVPGIAVQADVTRVIFMTTKKFLYGVRIIGGKFQPSNNLKNNLLIIDEVDKQQSVILDHIIDAKDVDLLSVFKTLQANLSLLQPTTHEFYDGISDAFLEFRDDIKVLFEKYNVNLTFDIDSELKNLKQGILLFSDKLTTHRTSVNAKLSVRLNAALSQNEIFKKSDSDSLPSDISFSLTDFLNELDTVINRDFYYLVKNSERIYQSNRNSDQNDEPVTSYQVISSILNQWNLLPIRKVIDANEADSMSKPIKASKKLEPSYHTRGLKLIEIDNPEKALNSVLFKLFSFNSTPTGLLASWVLSGANILGVSATADNKSVIHNFDICYLQNALQDLFIRVTKEQAELIRDYYHEQRNYVDNGVKVVVIALENKTDMLRESLLSYRPRARDEDEVLKYLFDKEDVEFEKKWLSNLLGAIANFICMQDNRYMVAMLPRTIKKEDDFISFFVGNESNKHKKKCLLFAKVNADFLSSGRYSSEIINELETTTNKVIVLTTYSTMATGKNPNYTFNSDFEGDSLRQVGARTGDKTDIDFIHLEKPTHLITGDMGNIQKSRLKLLSSIMSLNESGQISKREVKSFTDSVLTRSESSSNYILSGYARLPDYQFAMFRFIEQALGRTARSEVKRSTVAITLDPDLASIIAKDNREDELFTHEYQAVLDFCKKDTSVKPARDKESLQCKNHAQLFTERNVKTINKLLNAFEVKAKESDKVEWDDLRDFTLKFPALKVPAQEGPAKFRGHYVPSTTPGYYQYSHIENSSLEDYKCEFFDGFKGKAITVDEQSSGLDRLMKNATVKAFFERNGYCTQWPDDANYILVPPLFNNIYKGALGEAAGKAFFESLNSKFAFADMPLEQIEIFDGILSFGETQSYVDFKHLNLAALRAKGGDEQKKALDKAIIKLKDLPIKRLIICNTFKASEEPILYFDVDGKNVQPDKACILAIPALFEGESSGLSVDAIRAITYWMRS